MNDFAPVHTKDPRSWQQAAVYGLGLSGRAAVELLLGAGIRVVAYDDQVPAGSVPQWLDHPLAELQTGPSLTLADSLDALVVSPGIALDRPLISQARRDDVPILAEVELGFRWLEGPVVAVTGSNGKSTTTALAGALLEAAGFDVEVCGNIGRPLSACVNGVPGRVFVSELSSFQLETTDTFRPKAAALLNLSPDHLDRHGSSAEYLRVKQRIFEQQRADDVAVLNGDDASLAALELPSRCRWFSRQRPVSDGCWLDGDRVIESRPGMADQELFQLADLPIEGAHNLENAMAAMLLARALGAEVEALKQGLRNFRGLPHRLELVANSEGVRWFDDSKGTNVGATARSLEGFADGSVHLIAGGKNKGADLRQLRGLVQQKVRRLYLIGEAAQEFAAAMKGSTEVLQCETLPRAVQMAHEAAKPGEAVLLSPACASFDQFSSFAERGQVFQKVALSLVDPGLSVEAVDG